MSKTKKSAAATGAAPGGSAKKSAKSAQKREAADAQEESLPFEGALAELENTVGRLEEGEMPLEEALELFEAGVNLSRQCSATLEAAEQRIEILVADRKGGEEPISEPFEADAFEDDEDFDED
ncbi:MAG: exodeoxyribonuclease VII small subunit [bacterium]|nr:exodeoxyribonuclease VII small subunit [Deltaproteobacteria bacterium]MCP4907285.1 exodeoxyribonuclease VII small subunit [bacterium]